MAHSDRYWQQAFLLVFLLLAITVGKAQNVRGGAGFLYFGPSQWPGASSAIEQLSPSASAMGRDQYVLIGGEVYGRYNRWLAGLGVSALANKRIETLPSGSSAESSASNAHIWFGWVAWQTKRTKLYPSVGPGINSFNINTTTTSGKLTTYAINGFSTDIALTFDWVVLGNNPDKALCAGPMLSLRAGYRLTTASARWHGPTTLVATRYAPNGFFVTLGIGGGGFRARAK